MNDAMLGSIKKTARVKNFYFLTRKSFLQELQKDSGVSAVTADPCVVDPPIQTMRYTSAGLGIAASCSFGLTCRYGW